MATYNGGRYLREQLDSLLVQTMPFEELIICDDGSSDNTVSIICEYASRDKRIRLHQNREHIGFKANFEQAIRLCSCDFIALCDQDDIWMPEHIEVLYKSIGGRMLVCGDAVLVDSDGISDGRTLSGIKNFRKAPDDCKSIFRFIAYYQNAFQGASMMLHRKFLSIALPIPGDVRFHDVWFAHVACLFGSFRFVNKPITQWRIHDNNTSGRHVRHHPLRTIAGHFLKRNLQNNRMELIESLVNRFGDKKLFQIDEYMLKYYKNRGGGGNRLVNLIYEIMNYRKIYG